MRFLLFVSGLISILKLFAQAIQVENYIEYLPIGSNLALMVQKVGAKQPIIDYHSQQLSLPASTIKLLTALAALLQLGQDYRFITTLESSHTPMKGVIYGDLIVRFSGDPTFTRRQLHNMISELHRQGIKQITGNLIINTSIFDSQDKAPGWSWNNLTQCFNAPPSAAIIDRNCFSLSLYSANKVGELALAHVSSDYPVRVYSQVRTLAKSDNAARYCELNAISGELNHFTLTGCIIQRKKPLFMTFAIQDGASYAGDILKKELHQANILLSGKILKQTKIVPSNYILTQSYSARLHSLLNIMLKRSDNMIADTIFRVIGHERFKVPGTWRISANAVRQILQQQAGIDLGNSIQVDGSGLSRYDLISPAIMMQVLQYIGLNDHKLHLISMLPLAGYDGTLMYRTGLHEAGVDGKLSAKTGSLQGVYNLAGFITTARDQRIAFVQYLSGYTVSSIDSRMQLIPLIRLERRLYKDIYQNN